MRIPVIMKVAVAALALQRSAGCVDSTEAQGTQQRLTDGGDSLRIQTHEEILPVGLTGTRRPLIRRNPFAGDPKALGIGAQLFISYNCIDCHGADGAGAMGPGFQDGRWHFGGTPGDVFESIYQGRPEGMPSWGGRISDDQIWMLTAYVQSLAKLDLTTENFSGQTIERTGH
jgi:cytochrome c oxidase cbb3-type subunit 3